MKTKEKEEKKDTETKASPIDVEHGRMRKRAAEFEKEMDGTGVVMAEAFVRGMRDIGYKSTAYALNEIIDNAIEARAGRVLVELLPKKGGLEAVAVIDDGIGMPEEWIRHSIRWGASHRDQENLKGFGRFGYGMKSAAISFSRRFEVYSRIPGAKSWSVAYLDVEELAAGTYRNENKEVGVPPTVEAELPGWIKERLSEREVELDHGTVVVMSKIDSDRIRTRGSSAGASDPEKLKSFFLEQFGITYRNYLAQTPVSVDGRKVEPIDPLFITPGCRFFDIDDERAEVLPPLIIPVKSKTRKEIAGEIRARFSLLPPTFMKKSEHKSKADSADGRGSRYHMNERFPIRKENNGIIMLRAGRQIDVASTKCPWTTFQNNDRTIGIEIDFDPGLDDEFSVPTSKQQVIPSKRIWDILEENGVYDVIKELRARDKKWRTQLKEAHKKNSPDEKEENDPEMTPSEAAVKSAEKFATPPAQTETLEQETRASEEFEKKVEEEAKEKGQPAEKVREEKERQAKQRPYRIALESKGPLAPFIRAIQEGGQKLLYINRDHRFYLDVYSKTDGMVRYGIEALLFSIGFHWIRSSGNRRTFYDSEVVHWSTFLNAALEDLEQYDGSSDDEQASAEMGFAESIRGPQGESSGDKKSA